VENEADFQVEQVCILDRKFKVLKKKSTGMVKVQCVFYSPKDATWENEETMQEEYTQKFSNFEENRS
jgi:hypothetical protein